jgi:hypothetical protein
MKKSLASLDDLIGAVAIALSLLSTVAIAAEGTQWNPSPSGAARSDVRAERDHALATGQIAHGEMYGARDDARQPRANVDRADVKSELDRARSNGELTGRNEPYGGGSSTRARQPA